MKTVIIPSNMNPWTCEINGMKFSYKAGTEQTVPDEVAELIEAYNESLPKEAKEAGEEGQVWTKEQYGAGWGDLPEQEKELPSGGAEGQVLTKTATGVGWADAQGGGSGNIADLTTEVQAFWDKIAQAIESEEPVDPSLFVNETLALHGAIKTAKTAGKQIVASVDFGTEDDGNAVSDAYGFIFYVPVDGLSYASFQFPNLNDYPFSEYRVLCLRGGEEEFAVSIYNETLFGVGSEITMSREMIFEYSSFPN